MAIVTASLEIAERSAVAEARRLAAGLVEEIRLPEEAAGRVAIVVTELATNLFRHGGGGWCFLTARDEYGEPVVEVVVADSGPGIRDPGKAMTDGFSTSGTPGTGLGAVRRLSRDFDLYTQPSGGVVVVARVCRRTYGEDPPRESGELPFSGVVAAMQGEPVSGDAWYTDFDGSRTTVMVVDGLGHGPDAAIAAATAVSSFASSRNRELMERLNRIHEALRSTRGAAVAVAQVDATEMELRYAGIGNISGRIVASDNVQSLVSMNGTAGGAARSLREFRYPVRPGAFLIMHSDGISSRWEVDRYPGVYRKDPAVVASLIFRDHSRRHDDATVVALRVLDPAVEPPVT